jgi:hypothetical protein
MKECRSEWGLIFLSSRRVWRGDARRGRLAPVHALPGVRCEDRSFVAFFIAEVHGRCGGWRELGGDGITALAPNSKRVMAPLESEVVGVSA